MGLKVRRWHEFSGWQGVKKKDGKVQDNRNSLESGKMFGERTEQAHRTPTKENSPQPRGKVRRREVPCERTGPALQLGLWRGWMQTGAPRRREPWLSAVRSQPALRPPHCPQSFSTLSLWPQLVLLPQPQSIPLPRLSLASLCSLSSLVCACDWCHLS